MMKIRYNLTTGRYNSHISENIDQIDNDNINVSKENQNDSTDYYNETHGTYGSLLFDKRWLSKRSEIIERDQYQCVICGSVEKLQVHHRQYHIVSETGKFKPPWDYTNNLLISLCENCHKRGHNKFKVPIIKV